MSAPIRATALILMLALTTLVAPTCAADRRPLALHPENPHYFVFRGKPTLLITSGEHYGAVLNLDFDYVRYLDELKARRLNLTRTWAGPYAEQPGTFNIQNNTLAPAAGRFICPWARSETAGFAGGGNKFDLNRWDEAYFKRLRDFVEQAGKRGVVVELNLFCPFYEESQWRISPLNAINNIQGVGAVPSKEVWTLKHQELLRVQEAMIRKIVAELRDYDNLYYEICNEPYFGGVTLEWQRRVSHWITDAEGGQQAGNRHLISQNINNGSGKVTDPDPNVSILNYHYASPPDAVAQNYGLHRVIGCNETGFKGTGDTYYRQEAWDFVISGGGLFNNLDYSFTVATPDGSAKVTDPTPGGGGPAYRAQLAALRSFMEKLPFLKMAPANEILRGGVPAKATGRVLAQPGRVYVVYLRGGSGVAHLALALPTGRYRAEWIEPRSGSVLKTETAEAGSGDLTLESPSYQEDMVLRLARR
jgi:hypothetical protein